MNCFSSTRIVFLLCALSVLAGASRAHALIEVRAGYSLQTVSPSELNNGFSGFPKIEGLEVLSGDVIASVPLLPIGLGLRYEMLQKTETSSGISSKVDWTRTSVLLNKRLVDTGLYLGPIATVGLVNDFKYISDSGGATTYKADSQLTGSVGIEVGAKFMLLRVGGEVGYLYAPMGDLKDSADATVTSGGNNIKVDMSGPYYRATLGFGF